MCDPMAGPTSPRGLGCMVSLSPWFAQIVLMVSWLKIKASAAWSGGSGSAFVSIGVFWVVSLESLLESHVPALISKKPGPPPSEWNWRTSIPALVNARAISSRIGRQGLRRLAVL